MKKKLNVILIVLIILVLVQLITASEVKALTAQEYKSKIDAILATWEEKKFNNNVYGPDNHNSYYTCKNSKCGKGAWECLAFARYVQNQLYGCCEACGNLERLYSGSINSVTDLRVGDGLRYNGGAGWNHSIIIIDVEASNNRVRVMDCNKFYDDHTVRQWYMSFGELKNNLNKALANVNGESGSAYIMRSPGNNVITTSDAEAPVISDGYVDISSITSSSYKAIVKATDNVGISRVRFATWTVTNDQDDLIWEDGTYNSSKGQYEITVNKSKFNNSTDLYKTHVYVYDAAGNYSMTALDLIPMGSTVANLGNFTSRISLKENVAYVLGIEGTANSSKVQLESKSQTDNTQLWKFTRNTDGTYNITNVSTGKALDIAGAVDTNGTQVQIYDKNSSDAQKFYIMNYNGAYRLVAKFSANLKAIDLYGASIASGSKINLHDASSLNNVAQTWKFEKVATSLSISDTSVNLNVGQTKTLTGTISPSDVSNKTLKWSTSNSSIVTVSNGRISAVSPGTATITVKTSDGSNLSKTCKVTVLEGTASSVQYTTHVQNIGWQDYVSDGKMAGTSGKALRLEGIKIKLNSVYSGSVQYATHVQNIGWQNYVSNDAMSGTSGKSLRLEAIKIKLTGTISNYYDIYYRVHAQNFGWLDWAKNGEESGTVGYGFRLEGIEIKLVKKGGVAPGQTNFPVRIKEPNVEYTTHVQNIGWQDYVSNGKMAGTSGNALRLEGIKIKLSNQRVSGNIEYSTHVQNIGWQSFVKNDEISGTLGKSLRLEAIKIRLTDKLAELYDVYYRVHAENAGWLGWAKNGEESGTSGYGFRLEGIEIRIVPKGSNAPGSTTNKYLKNTTSTVFYSTEELLESTETKNEIFEEVIKENIIENNISNENTINEIIEDSDIVNEIKNNTIIENNVENEIVDNDAIIENNIENEIVDTTNISNETIDNVIIENNIENEIFNTIQENYTEETVENIITENKDVDL